MYDLVPYPCTRGTHTPIGWHNYVYQSGKIFCSFCGSVADQPRQTGIKIPPVIPSWEVGYSSNEKGEGMRESLDRGIAEAARGETKSLGGFAKYITHQEGIDEETN